MEQKDVSVVIVEWSNALRDGIPHMPPAKADRITHATGDLLDALATTAMELSYHAPIPEDVRLKLEALAVAAKTVLEYIADLRADAEAENERMGVAEQREGRLEGRIDNHEKRIATLEERALAAREA